MSLDYGDSDGGWLLASGGPYMVEIVVVIASQVPWSCQQVRQGFTWRYTFISHTPFLLFDEMIYEFDGMEKKEKYKYSGGISEKCIKKVKINKTDSRSDENYRWPSVYPPALLIFLFN